MTDFLGNEIKVGMYCAYPGAGNVKAEYGMILYKIIEVDDPAGKIKAGRIYVHYGQGVDKDSFPESHTRNSIFYRDKDYTVAFQYKISTISSSYKFAVVEPSENIKAVFNRISVGDPVVFDVLSAEDIANWIHGKGVI